ncbi:MAG: histidine phosphatase family protein [Candidatus Moraniibacteriota bacterium]
MPENRAVTLFLVRHGQAASVPAGLVSSLPEGAHVRSLTPDGEAQIRATADALKSEGISLIIASPLKRTQESAEILSAVWGARIVNDIRLRETDFGTYNGLPVAEYFAHYPSPESRRTAAQGQDGVENFANQEERAASFLRDVAAECAGQTVAVVSHGDTLVALYQVLSLQGAEGTDPDEYWSPAVGTFRKVILSVG